MTPWLNTPLISHKEAVTMATTMGLKGSGEGGGVWQMGLTGSPFQ